jgi:hypothetical protein
LKRTPGGIKLPGISPGGSDKPISGMSTRPATAHLSRFRNDHKGRICGCGKSSTGVIAPSLSRHSSIKIGRESLKKFRDGRLTG